jgi:hypothetical protein
VPRERPTRPQLREAFSRSSIVVDQNAGEEMSTGSYGRSAVPLEKVITPVVVKAPLLIEWPLQLAHQAVTRVSCIQLCIHGF